ncbi:importin-9 [Tetranychus urticae]|uniref:Importin N-terminal domain-containing protein n=1 Tax=Tetranychus urticae TaxID=32264 RepID=T1KML6_TETUR|nr:importin-9 [Tetranychus urticae]
MSAQRTLKDALYENLFALLSTDSTTRRNAEEQLKMFEATDEYGAHLTEISIDGKINGSIRRLASVILKHFIDSHWSSKSDKFQAPEIIKAVKARIRSSLLRALGEPRLLLNGDDTSEKKMRGSIAFVISGIAHYDWPDEWTDLFDILIGYINSENLLAIYGSMKVFTEMCHEISELQIPDIAPILLPRIYDILVNPYFSIGTRGRAIQVYSELAETITMIGELDKSATKQFLDPVLPQFTTALIKIIEAPDSAADVDLGLKKKALSALTLLIKNCRKRMWKYMPAILTPVWYNLTSFASLYVKVVVNSESEEAKLSNYQPGTDSDGDSVSVEEFIFAIFDFVSVITETSKSRKLIKHGISDLLYYILIYMQITDEQMETWSSNPDRFVEDEDDDSYSYSVRISALDVLMSLAREYEENESKEENLNFQMALLNAIKKHFTESYEAKANSNNYWWWKIQECCLLAFGSISTALMDTVKENGPLADEIRAILDTCSNISADVSPFFAGRYLWTAAVYAPIMNSSVIDRFIQATLSGLLNVSPIIKISSIRAAYNICIYLQETHQVDFIKPYLPQILEVMVSIGTAYSNEVLALVLQTIKTLVSLDKVFAASVESKVSALAIETFLRHSADPVLITSTQDIFKELSKNPDCIGPLQQQIIPTLVSILNPPQSNQTVQTLQPVAMDILTTIIRNSTTPLSESLINQCFPAAAFCILSTIDDNSTMQNGGECIRAFVSKAVEQVAAYREPESGEDGMSIVMQVCLHLLDPRVNESCAAFVGKLIFITIIKGSQFIGNDNVNLLLRSVLSKLQTSESLSVIQSLIMVFAHLINHDLPTVLDFLSSLPGPSGSQSALEFVLNQWLGRQHMFYGAYESKVSIIALCKLLQNSLVNADQDQRLNLNLIRVPGDPMVDSSPGIKTRSKTQNKNERWTLIPCSVKILKLLLNEVFCIESTDDISDHEFEDEEEEEEDHSIDENRGPNQCGHGGDSVHVPSTQFHELIEAIESDFDEEDEEEEDEDILNDPISKINLGQHLTSFVRSFTSTPFATQFMPHLNENELNILQKISRH